MLALVWLLAWDSRGSLAPRDWLGYAVLAGLGLAVLLLSGTAARPPALGLLAIAALIAAAAWSALSLAWSPVPSFGHDEVLLRLLYAVALAVPLLSLRDAEERRLAVVIFVVGIGGLAVTTALVLRFGSNPVDRYLEGRLDTPVSYPNAQAALFLLGFWPAVGLAARRASHVAVRTLALAAAAASLSGCLLAQSKGSAVGLVLSTLVLFAVCPWRLRLFVPTAICFALAAAAYGPLTEPYRAFGHGEAGAIRHAGTTVLLLTAIGAVLGLAYALADRRLELSARTQRVLGLLAAAALVLALLGGFAAFFVKEPHPGRFASHQWHRFRDHPIDSSRYSSHFADLGSNRYDFWRVAASDFAHHPLVGLGAYGWYPSYIRQGHSYEAPLRGHSLLMDELSEEGLIGTGLLGAALGLPLLAAVRRRRSLSLVAFGGAIAFLGHAFVDWIWSVPPVGVAAWVLLGIGAARDAYRPLTARASRLVGAGALVATLLLLGLPWLSARLTQQAARGPSNAAADLRWARRLDPLSLDPILVENDLARTPQEKIRALKRGLALEPDYVSLQAAIGRAYLAAGDKAAALKALRHAVRLDPYDAKLRATLRRAEP
ncbi:MAG: hypothetical protein QOE36_3524 [Gaiellaceae bacterium]|nr:hypothetical protein [Gaiellaceae bacterium]